ncbi:MAG: hypothetical protein H6844_00760 [Alphaproteobacteria bacterium]|nr:hypothetical protein [Alphaproteobacteria bacterium]
MRKSLLGQAMGAALSPPYVVALLALVSWREAWWVTAALVLLALPVAVGLMRGQPAPMSLTGRGGDNPPVAGHRLGQVLRDPGLWLRLPVLLTPAFLSTGYVFHQVHIAHAKAWPIELVAASFTAYAIAQVAGLMTAGQLVDRFSARRLVPLFLAPLGLCSVVLALAGGLLAGAGLSGPDGVRLRPWQRHSGRALGRALRRSPSGAIRSFGAALMVFSSGLAPMVMGLAFDAGTGIAAVALAGAVWCVLASLVASLAQRPAGRGEASALD